VPPVSGDFGAVSHTPQVLLLVTVIAKVVTAPVVVIIVLVVVTSVIVVLVAVVTLVNAVAVRTRQRSGGNVIHQANGHQEDENPIKLCHVGDPLH
jgi:hypothetical protein